MNATWRAKHSKILKPGCFFVFTPFYQLAYTGHAKRVSSNLIFEIFSADPLCTLTSCSSTTAPSKPHPNPRRRPLVAAQPPTRAHIRSLPQAPRTTATASSSYRSSTAFIWHSSGGRCPPQCPPALKTSTPSSPRSPSSLKRVTEQLTKHWSPFKVLRQRYAGTRLEEQRQLHLPQKYKATVPDSTLRVEMNNLEEHADNAKARELFWKPLGAIRLTSANDAFDPALWETFVCTTLGLEVPILTALPRLHNSPLAKCGCKKFCMDFHGDHTSTCTALSGATKAHDWMVSVLGPLFRTA